MHVLVRPGSKLRVVVALFAVIGAAVLLSSSDRPVYTENQKAFYADPNLVNFVRPGLVLKIVSASIESDGTIRARFRLTDPRGLPLDISGVTTPGPISVRLTAAYIPKGKTQYVAYTTRVQTSPITRVSAEQAYFDVGGTFTKVAEGEYVYTFRTRAPTNFDRTTTHAIGAWAARNLAEFNLESIINYDSDVYTWVPDGSRVTVVRDVIRTETCNKCHDPLSAHDNRRTMELCVLCHTPQTIDPDTGESMDMPVLTHRIHMGSSLPSVRAGKPYRVIGFQQRVFDYSTVVFPADARNCTFCHEQKPGVAQANAFLKPSRAACGSCHDNVNFATGENHANLPQLTDNMCGTCHVPQGELEFDLSVLGAHTIPRFSRDLPGVVFEILRVTDGSAGRRPTVTFTVKERSGKPIPLSQMSRIALVLAGPTTDYATYVVEDASRATCGADGTCTYTFTYTIPATARGTYAVGIEGYRTLYLLAGTRRERSVRDAGANQVVYFSVDGSRVAPRREVVSMAKCNNCHFSFSIHGENRNRIEQCVLCHNPVTTDRAVRPAAELPPESIDMRYMTHRIHLGERSELPYVVYGRGSVRYDYSHVRYPGDLRNCDACHVNGSERLPLRAGLLSVTTPRGRFDPTGPATAACLSCHTSVAAAAHALTNTSDRLGEACAACHGANSEFSVQRVHAR